MPRVANEYAALNIGNIVSAQNLNSELNIIDNYRTILFHFIHCAILTTSILKYFILSFVDRSNDMIIRYFTDTT